MAKITVDMQDLIDVVNVFTGDMLDVKNIEGLVNNLSSFEGDPCAKWNAHFIARVPKGLRIYNQRTGCEITDGQVIDAVENPDLLCLYNGKGWIERDFSDLPQGAIIQMGFEEDADVYRYERRSTEDTDTAYSFSHNRFLLQSIFRVIEVPRARPLNV